MKPLTIPEQVKVLAHVLGGQVIVVPLKPNLCQVVIAQTATTREKAFAGVWRNVLRKLKRYQPEPLPVIVWKPFKPAKIFWSTFRNPLSWDSRGRVFSPSAAK